MGLELGGVVRKALAGEPVAHVAAGPRVHHGGERAGLEEWGLRCDGGGRGVGDEG